MTQTAYEISKLLIQVNSNARTGSLWSRIISLANAKSLFKINFGHKIFIFVNRFSKFFASHITTNLAPNDWRSRGLNQRPLDSKASILTTAPQPLLALWPLLALQYIMIFNQIIHSKFGSVSITLAVLQLNPFIKLATTWEILFMLNVNNKGADQPAHPRSLISTFVVRCLDSIISLVSISEISRL